MNISQVWPEWHEECVLGEGSFGKVYRAKRVEYGRTFYSAIKVLTVPKNQQEIKFARSQGMNDQEIYAYFQGLVENLLNEITLMDNLKGAKNIVGIEDYKIIQREGEIGWDIFIRMELLTPFDSFISNPEFSQKDVIRLGVDICSALEICEQNFIVHRDIKPDNIFISRFGEYKLGDFGIARKLEATQANLSRKGTLNYMAPEVYKSEQYGSNVDIYSLGLVMYTLLNNNRVAFLPPYPQPISYKDNEEALSRRLSGETLMPPCNASATLGAAIVKACAYRPQDRYQSATEFKNTLIAEWNTLIQSGDYTEISSDAMRFSGDMSERIQRTTNDMTANGRLVVQEYAQGTTVLDGNISQADYTYSGVQQSGEGAYLYTNPQVNIEIPTTYESVKKIKVARIASKVLSIALIVLGGISLYNYDVESFYMLSLAFMALFSNTNKKAVGLASIAVVAAYGLGPVSHIINNGFFGMSVDIVVGILIGLLILFGGIVILTQKEIAFGGTLVVTAAIIEWGVKAYQIVSGNIYPSEITFNSIGMSLVLVTIFIWTMGYRKTEKPEGNKKIFHFVSYAGVLLSALAAASIFIDKFM